MVGTRGFFFKFGQTFPKNFLLRFYVKNSEKKHRNSIISGFWQNFVKIYFFKKKF